MSYVRFLNIALLASACLLHAGTAGESRGLTSQDQVPEGLAKSDWISIRAAYEGERYAFQPVEGGWQASNPGQQWITKFDHRGFITEPNDGEWSWGLELKSYGFGEEQHAIGGRPVVNADGKRLTYTWDTNVQEWFVNDRRGLEHGFTVSERPKAAASPDYQPLDFRLTLRGTLRPCIANDSLGVEFHAMSGTEVITYSGLKVWDADGRILPSRFAAADENSMELTVDERGARYPLTIDPVVQQAQFKGVTPKPLELHSSLVGVSGDTVVVGGQRNDNAAGEATGSVHVYVRNGATWTHQAELFASDALEYAYFGTSVAISGNTIVVGAPFAQSFSGDYPGSVYVFVRSGTTWTQQAHLFASDGAHDDRFGFSTALSGDTLVVGAPFDDIGTSQREGSAYVFERTGVTWTQRAHLFGSQGQPEDYFGFSVGVSDDTVVVGAPSDIVVIGFSPGTAYVYAQNGNVWAEQAVLRAADGQVDDEFGYSVAVSGDTVVVGADADDTLTGNASGSVFVYTRSAGTWTQQAQLFATDAGVEDHFGMSLALQGDALIIGAANDDTPAGLGAGSAYVFARNGTTWTQRTHFFASDGASNDFFGEAVALWGDTIVVGAPFDDNGAGSAYIFDMPAPDIAVSGNNADIADGDNTPVATDNTYFGSVYVASGNAEVRNYVITNGGDDDLTLGTVAVNGIHSGDFSVDAQPASTVPPGGTTSFQVRFVPTATGLRSAVLNIVNNDNDENPFNFSIQGTGLNVPQPDISVSGNHFEIADGDSSPFTSDLTSFGFVSVTGGKTVRTFVITNNGDANLALGTVVISGEHAGDFNVDAQPASTLAPGGSTSFQIRFAPGAAGLRSAELSIDSNDVDETPFNFSIQGTGVRYTDLGITVSDGQTTTNPGVGIAYTIVASNNGSSAASGATVIDTFPAALSGVNWTGLGTGGATGPASGLGNINAKVDLPSGASFTFTVSAAISRSAVGTLANTATIFAPGDVTDFSPSNNSSTDTNAVVPRVVVSTAALGTGDAAPGAGASGLPGDAVLASFGTPATDLDGDLAFVAKWNSATGGKGSGLFLNSSCLGILGGDVPGISGAIFRSFTDPVVDGGSVACIVALGGVPAPTASAVMSNAPASNALDVIARTGGIAPDFTGNQPAGGANFKKFSAVSIAGGRIAFLAQLTGGSGAQKAMAATDNGLWIKDGSDTLKLAVREGQMIGSRTIKSLVSFVSGAGSPGQGRGWLTQTGGPAAMALAIFTDKSQAILSFEAGGTATVVSETGVIGTNSAPAISDAEFASYSFPAANDNGTSAFLATMKAGTGGVTKSDARGIFWRDAAGGYALLARIGMPAGGTGANFSLLKDPVLSADDAIAFPATIKGGAVKSLATQTLWWTPAPGTLALLAQGGKRPGPDLPAESQWKSFTSLAIAAGRGPIFTATLVSGKGAVTGATAAGVWATDYAGAPRLLFRTGDMIGGKKLARFDLLKATAGNLGVTRSFNDAAEVVWLATFTDKTQAIIRTDVP